MNAAVDTGSHFATLALLVLYWTIVCLLPQLLRSPGDGPVSDGDRPATALTPALEALRKADPLFNEASFLRNATDAYEAVVKAYAKGDLAPVERLVGPEVLEVLRSVIAGRRQRHETLELALVSIRATAISAFCESDAVEIVVEYVSQVVRVTRAADYTVVEGDPTRIVEVTDAWTFARAPKTWILIATDLS